VDTKKAAVPTQQFNEIFTAPFQPTTQENGGKGEQARDPTSNGLVPGDHGHWKDFLRKTGKKNVRKRGKKKENQKKLGGREMNVSFNGWEREGSNIWSGKIYLWWGQRGRHDTDVRTHATKKIPPEERKKKAEM